MLETVVYCDDLAAAEEFYTGVVGLEKVAADPDRHLFMRCGAAMLLVFRAETTASVRFHVGESPIPLHGATGAGHVAFRVREVEIPEWRAHLTARGVAIETEVGWPGAAARSTCETRPATASSSQRQRCGLSPKRSDLAQRGGCPTYSDEAPVGRPASELVPARELKLAQHR